MKNILFLTGFFLAITATAQQGTLDSSFAGNGIVLNENLRPLKVDLQQSKKIIVCGSALSNGISGSALVRYHEDGNMDSSFGNNGYVVLPFDLAGQGPFGSMIVLKDDKILASSSGANIFIAKFTADGKPDSAFGENGYIQNHFTFNESMSNIQVQADGKILVCGSQTSGFYDPFYALLVRYTPEGMLDTSFGDAGKVVLYESLGLSSLAIQKDGKIVVGGTADAGDSEFFVARLNSNGSYDESFGSHGYVYTRFSENRRDGLASVALQPDGKILGAGYCNNYGENQDMGIARYNTDGSLDNSFGENGLKAIKFNNKAGLANVVLLQKDGKIILSGSVFNGRPLSEDAALVKLNANGSLDSSFGENGISITNLSLGSDVESGAILQADGKIIITGLSASNLINYGNIARFNNTDETRRQILIAKLRRWWQHHNGIVWDNIPGAKSYAVQRGANGMNWSTIFSSRDLSNRQQSVGNSYADPSPLPGTNYYRLQTTSVDGAVTYSNVIAIGDENSPIGLSPNPAKNVLQISGLSSLQKTKIMVVDLSGNMAINPKLITNSTSYNLNIATLKPGNYMLRIESNGIVVTKQFVKD